VTIFPIERVRSQFPALNTPSIFLDNPAGTQVPRQVIEAVSGAMVGAASNAGGYFRASLDADAIYARAHEAMAELLGGASGREIVIGQSMTMLTFQIARSLEDLHVQNFDDYIQYLPSVAIKTTGPGQDKIYMRGVASGGDGVHDGTVPSVYKPRQIGVKFAQKF
jgi:hypothetical protein